MHANIALCIKGLPRARQTRRLRSKAFYIDRMFFDAVLVQAKAIGVELVGSIITRETTPEEFEKAIADGVGRAAGTFRLFIVVDGAYCLQSASHIVTCCQKFLKEGDPGTLETHFPGCLGSGAAMQSLMFSVVPVPKQKAQTEPSKGVRHRTEGGRTTRDQVRSAPGHSCERLSGPREENSILKLRLLVDECIHTQRPEGRTLEVRQAEG